MPPIARAPLAGKKRSSRGEPLLFLFLFQPYNISMLHVFYGNDFPRVRKELRKTIDSLLAKRKESSVISVEGGAFDAESLESYVSVQGLFEKSSIIVFDGILKNEEAAYSIGSALEDMAGSSNIFILVEEEIASALLKKLEKYAKVSHFEGEKGGPVFNIFSLAEALGRRDRKTLWVLYEKAKLAGVSDEEMHGILLWQVRTMLLARGSQSAGDAGLKPFVFTKAANYEKKYPDKELRDLSERFVSVLHDDRRGSVPFEIGFEKLLLSV